MSKIINLSGIKNGVISIEKIDEPYGKGSASVGINLKGDVSNP